MGIMGEVAISTGIRVTNAKLDKIIELLEELVKYIGD